MTSVLYRPGSQGHQQPSAALRGLTRGLHPQSRLYLRLRWAQLAAWADLGPYLPLCSCPPATGLTVKTVPVTSQALLRCGGAVRWSVRALPCLCSATVSSWLRQPRGAAHACYSFTQVLRNAISLLQMVTGRSSVRPFDFSDHDVN